MVQMENTAQQETLTARVRRNKITEIRSPATITREWKKGIEDNDGYFTLIDPETENVLTALTPQSRDATGNPEDPFEARNIQMKGILNRILTFNFVVKNLTELLKE